MNIKKSRIIQIIKEEVQKLAEDDGDDSGLAPVDLDPVDALRHRYQQEQGVSMEHVTDADLLKYAAEQLQALQRKLKPLPKPPSMGDKTVTAPVSPEAKKVYNNKMGIE